MKRKVILITAEEFANHKIESPSLIDLSDVDTVVFVVGADAYVPTDVTVSYASNPLRQVTTFTEYQKIATEPKMLHNFAHVGDHYDDEVDESVQTKITIHE